MKDTDIRPFSFIFWLMRRHPDFVFRFGYNSRLNAVEMDISQGHLHIRRIVPIDLSDPDMNEWVVGAIEDAVREMAAMLKREEEA